MTPEGPTPPRRRSPGAPVNGRRPRPTTAAALIDDTFAELTRATVDTPLPEVARRRPTGAPRRTPAASPRPRRTAPATPVPTPTTIVVAAPRAVRAPEPAVTTTAAVVVREVRTWTPPTRLRAWVPPALMRPWALPAPLLGLPARLHRPRYLRAITALALITAIVSVVALVVDVRSGMSVPSASADLVTVLPLGSGASSLTIADATALADPTVVPDATAVAPVVSRTEPLAAGSRQTSVTMTGTTGAWLAVSGRRLLAGRVFTPTEVTNGTRVAVLASSTAQLLFPTGNAIGGTLSIAGLGFRVVGVLSPPAGGGSDAGVLVPVTAAQGITDTAGLVDRILVDTASPQSAFAAYQEADALLLQTHHAANPFSTDFSLGLPANAPVSALVVTALGVLAAVALLLAGVAIRSLRRAS